MNIPSDPWARIGHAEILIRSVVTRSTEWPADMTADQLEKLEEIMDYLDTMLSSAS